MRAIQYSVRRKMEKNRRVAGEERWHRGRRCVVPQYEESYSIIPINNARSRPTFARKGRFFKKNYREKKREVHGEEQQMGENLPRGRSAEPKARLYRRRVGGEASAASRAAWRRRSTVACGALGVPAWYSARPSGARKKKRGNARKETRLAGCLYL